jgi:hypothetical protein
VSRKPNGAASEGVKDYAYVEVMACPGGCTNGGGQVKVAEVEGVRVTEGLQDEVAVVKPGPKEQKEWLARVDEAYFSGEEGEEDRADDVVNGISRSRINDVMAHWSAITGVDTQTLLYTSYRKVESDVGKKVSDMERVAGLAVTVGGGW